MAVRAWPPLLRGRGGIAGLVGRDPAGRIVRQRCARRSPDRIRARVPGLGNFRHYVRRRRSTCCSPSAARRPAPMTSRRWRVPGSGADISIAAETARCERAQPRSSGCRMRREYAIGFPPNFQQRQRRRRASATATIPAGHIMRRPLCGGTALERPASSCAMARRPRHRRSRLAVRRPVSTIDGLQGHAIAARAPAERAAVRSSYFIDYDDRTDRRRIDTGHLGDVAIWRVCGQAMLPLPLPVAVACPAGWFNVDGVCQFPARLSGGNRICQRLLRLSRLPGELCAQSAAGACRHR